MRGHYRRQARCCRDRRWRAFVVRLACGLPVSLNDMSCIDFDLDTLHRIKITILSCISKDTKKINTDVKGEPLLY